MKNVLLRAKVKMFESHCFKAIPMMLRKEQQIFSLNYPANNSQLGDKSCGHFSVSMASWWGRNPEF